MAFTDAQKVKLCKILGINPRELDVHLLAYTSSPTNYITAEVETEVIAQIARWEAGTGINRVWFTPTESNEGFNQTGNPIGGDPKTNIETLLFFTPSGNGTEFELIRG